jgi:hypothetical protein
MALAMVAEQGTVQQQDGFALVACAAVKDAADENRANP